MIGGLLASLFVEFSAKGLSSAKGSIDKGAGALRGWTSAGLAATVEGERLAFAQSHLSQTVASIFLPAITKATAKIFEFSNKLSASEGAVKFQDAVERLSGSLEKIWNFGEPTIFKLFEGFANTVDRVAEGLEKVVGLIGQIGVKTTDVEKFMMEALKGMGSGGQILALMGEQMFGLGKEKKPGHGIERLTRSGGGMSTDVAHAYQSIQQAAIRFDTNYPKRAVEIAEKQLKVSEDIAGNTQRAAKGQGSDW